MNKYLVLGADERSTQEFQQAFADTIVVPSSILAVAVNYAPLSTAPLEQNRTLQGIRTLRYPGGVPPDDSLDLSYAVLPAPIDLVFATFLDVYDANPTDLLGRDGASIISDGDSVSVAVFQSSPPLSSVRRFLNVTDNGGYEFIPHAIAVPIQVTGSVFQAATRAASDFLHGKVFRFDQILTTNYRPYLPDTASALAVTSGVGGVTR